MKPLKLLRSDSRVTVDKIQLFYINTNHCEHSNIISFLITAVINVVVTQWLILLPLNTEVAGSDPGQGSCLS